MLTTCEECGHRFKVESVDSDGVLDDCQTDCNQDGIPDGDQLAELDCDANGILDVCDVDPNDPDGDGAVAEDCNDNALPDRCEPDCDGNGIVDSCDLDPLDPDNDGEVADDCNQNGVPDACDRQRNIGQIARITPPMDTSGIFFGCSIALDNDLLIDVHGVGRVEAVEAAPGPHHRVLHGVLGVERRAQHPVAMPGQRRTMGFELCHIHGHDVSILLLRFTCGVADGRNPGSDGPGRSRVRT